MSGPPVIHARRRRELPAPIRRPFRTRRAGVFLLGLIALGRVGVGEPPSASASPARSATAGRFQSNYVVRLKDAGGAAVQRRTGEVFRQRLAAFDLRAGPCELLGTNEIEVQVSAPSEQSLAMVPDLLRRRGGLELRCVHPESDQLLQQGRFPPGYEMMAERAPPDQAARVHLVARQPSGPGSGDVASAQAAVDAATGQSRIEITFSEEGAARFTSLTRTNVGRTIALIVEGEILMAPMVRQEIQGGRCVLAGNFTAAEARLLAALMAHPLPASVQSVRAVVKESVPQVSLDTMLVEISGTNLEALKLESLLGDARLMSIDPDAATRGDAVRTVTGAKTDPRLQQVIQALDAPPAGEIATLRGDQLEWSGRCLTNAANIRLTAALGPATSGVLSGPQYHFMVRALGQRRGLEVLSAPRVTTPSGQVARIRLGTAVDVRTDINPEAIVRPGVWGRTNIPTYLTAQIPVGPSVDLLPMVGANGQTIELTVTPTLVDFLGYDPPLRGGKVRVWRNGVKKRLDPPLPRFRVRQMPAKVPVEPGQTLVVGTWPAKEPGTDQTAQTPSTRSNRKRAGPAGYKRLLVFVTPTIVSPTVNAGPEP